MLQRFGWDFPLRRGSRRGEAECTAALDDREWWIVHIHIVHIHIHNLIFGRHRSSSSRTDAARRSGFELADLIVLAAPAFLLGARGGVWWGRGGRCGVESVEGVYDPPAGLVDEGLQGVWAGGVLGFVGGEVGEG